MSLLEVTIAMGLLMAVTASLFALMHPAEGAFSAEPEAADVQQRLRVAVDLLSKDLAGAGSGAYIGARAGPLVDYFAPIRPIRAGTQDDAVTMTAVETTAVQTVLAADFPSGSDTVQVASGAGCQVGAALCGIKAGMTLLIFDQAGHADVFSVVDVTGQYARLRMTSRPAGAARPDYPAGAAVVEAQMRTYSRKITASPRSDQLMRDDNPVLDHFVGLTFTYYGDPAPPMLTQAGPTYGPQPPPLNVQTTAYPPGENCAFVLDASTTTQVSRLPALAGAGALVELSADQFADGPWCPDDLDTNRWDADLLRIRTIGISVRIEAALESLRGPAGPLFVNGGHSRTSGWVPDQETHWKISPRNLNAGR